MSSINNVPSEYRSGFINVFLLNSDDFKSIVEGLKGVSLTHSIKKLATVATAFKPELLEEVIDIFLSISSVTSVIEKGISIEEIAHDICIIMSDEIKEEIETLEEDDELIDEKLRELLDEAGKQIFIERLVVLLKTEKLYYAAKANDLMFEYPNVFIQARIMTDIRPIFSIKTDETPIAGMVIHNLHIHYRGDRETEHRDIYLTLDSADLISLKEIISRAENKEKSLSHIFKKSDMNFINE